MSRRAASWLAWSLWALCVALFASAVLLDFFNPSVPTSDGPIFDLYIAIPLLAYPTVGAIVASRLPKNLVGWILCGIGLLFGVHVFAEAYAYYAAAAGSVSLPGGCIWLGSQQNCSCYRACSWVRHC
jgi:hypothetical protein